MKILFLCHRLPYPPDHGGKIRPYNFIRHLGKKHSVTVASLADSEKELKSGSPLNESCEDVIAEVLPSRVRRFQALKALFTSTPSSVAYFWSRDLFKRIKNRLETAEYDVVLVFCASMAQYVLNWQDGYRVLDYGDLDSAKWADYARWRAFPLSLGYAIESAKLRRYERRIARHFHRCTVISQGELDEFKKLSVPVPCTIIPNGVDTTYFGLNGKEQDHSSAIVFLGRMDYFPNIEGIIYFARQVFPIIREKMPAAELRIVGSNPTRSVRELSRVPNVLITGHVPDVRGYLKDAAVSVAPLRIARGSQNKILESMAMGIPVVATRQAAKGISAISGEHLLVADEPEAFANQVLAVLEDFQLNSRLAEAGRAQVEHAHAWSVSMEVLDGVLAEAGKNES